MDGVDGTGGEEDEFPEEEGDVEVDEDLDEEMGEGESKIELGTFERPRE